MCTNFYQKLKKRLFLQVLEHGKKHNAKLKVICNKTNVILNRIKEQSFQNVLKNARNSKLFLKLKLHAVMTFFVEE